MRDGVFPADDAQLRNLLLHVEGLSRLVDDLRVVTLQDSGRLNMLLAPTDVSVEVRRAVESMRNVLESTGLAVELTLAPVVLRCDAARVRQAVLAVLDNARRHARTPRPCASRRRSGPRKSHAGQDQLSYNIGSIDQRRVRTMQLVSPEKIAAVMGLSPVPHSIAELEAQVAEGLPKSALRHGVEQIALTAESRRALQARIVPEATYKRRRDRLTPDESEKTERLARVYASAAYVWDDPADARTFLATPHPLLEGRAPLEVALTELGARRVEELLWKLFYGLPA